MITNKIAHLFILHVLNSLDDTVLSKKKILNDMLLTIDENKADECFSRILIGIYSPGSKQYFMKEDIEGFECLIEHTSSKKEAETRRMELL